MTIFCKRTISGKHWVLISCLSCHFVFSAQNPKEINLNRNRCAFPRWSILLNFLQRDRSSRLEVIDQSNILKKKVIDLISVEFQFLDKHLVWKSNSADANEKWRKEFRVRPSWCDADLCLQQIKRGRATGNLWALYSRSFIQVRKYANEWKERKTGFLTAQKLDYWKIHIFLEMNILGTRKWIFPWS